MNQIIDSMSKDYIRMVGNDRYGIRFLVDGDKLVFGHVGIVKRNRGDKVKIENNQIFFCVDYVTTIGTQCATIPDADKNLKLFNKIIKANRGVILVFRTEETNPFIKGIGSMTTYIKSEYHKYGKHPWMFWK